MKRLRTAIFLICAAPIGFAASLAHAADAGAPAPALSLPTATGETVALDQLNGKVIYIDFWAS